MLTLELTKAEVLFPFNFRHAQSSLGSVIFETASSHEIVFIGKSVLQILFSGIGAVVSDTRVGRENPSRYVLKFVSYLETKARV